MQLDFGNKSAERIESTDIATNQKFAVIIYDANEPDNILSSYSSNGSILFDVKSEKEVERHESVEEVKST